MRSAAEEHIPEFAKNAQFPSLPCGFVSLVRKLAFVGTTNYLYDGANMMEEIDGGGNVLARCTQANNLDEPLSELRSTTSYYEADGLGSVTSLSGGSGLLSNTYTYDTFGNVTAFTGTVTNPFRYTGWRGRSRLRLRA
jgi:hypothetical protein